LFCNAIDSTNKALDVMEPIIPVKSFLKNVNSMQNDLQAQFDQSLHAGSQWWKKNGKWVTTAAAVVGFGVCVFATAGGCIAASWGVFTISTAGNVTMFAAGDQGLKSTAINIGVDALFAKMPGVAGAQEAFLKENAEMVAANFATKSNFKKFLWGSAKDYGETVAVGKAGLPVFLLQGLLNRAGWFLFE
jgi:hypothetical protein